jgi:AraC family transcriptional regulator, regulatory protein of adaptative response / methylated-DNA-[protein]-cysteine methyltransferase
MQKLPSSKTMYQALTNRDSEFEGVFWVAVKSTGIFCRPTCHSKKPKPENVEFFATTNEALYAGYRPCLRCRPLDKHKQPPEIVVRLSQEIERAPSGKITNIQLRAMGIDPSTARRQFKRYYGMTFQAYHRSRRMGQALHEIRNGESVIGAQIDHGFESASGFWDAFKQLFGAPPSKATEVKYLLAKWLDTPLGAMLALADNEGLHLLEFVDRRGLENEIKHIRKRLNVFIVPGENKILENISDEINRYFEGSLTEFTTPMVLGGTPFEKSVWKQLQKIPPGQTRSYSQIASRLGKPSATRAVGRANGRNCLAIVIPCHRVIRADGSLCGYGGGIWRKQWLLDHERLIAGKVVASR